MSSQGLYIITYLTLISFEPDNKADQITIYLYFGSLYYTFTQNQSTHLRKIFALLDILEKCYAKLSSNDIYKLERKPAYIVVFC